MRTVTSPGALAASAMPRSRSHIAASFARSRQTYGSLRVRADLQELGERCGKNQIGHLMREQHLRPAQKRRFRPETNDSRHTHQVAENWLAKVPAPDRPGMVWQSDFTCMKTAKAGSISPSPSMAARAAARPATFALTAQRQTPPPGLLHHSDRGVQYAAEAFAQLTAAWGVTHSMSRKGNPDDEPPPQTNNYPCPPFRRLISNEVEQPGLREFVDLRAKLKALEDVEHFGREAVRLGL